MNTININAGTDFTPFQLHLRHSPRLIPLGADDTSQLPKTRTAHAFLERLQIDLLEARDILLASEATQVRLRTYINGRRYRTKSALRIGDVSHVITCVSQSSCHGLMAPIALFKPILPCRHTLSIYQVHQMRSQRSMHPSCENTSRMTSLFSLQ